MKYLTSLRNILDYFFTTTIHMKLCLMIGYKIATERIEKKSNLHLWNSLLKLKKLLSSNQMAITVLAFLEKKDIFYLKGLLKCH